MPLFSCAARFGEIRTMQFLSRCVDDPFWCTRSAQRARTQQRFKRSLFCCRTAHPSHTDATMWPKHAPETSAADTNWSCGPRGFHVHAWSEPRMCLHHAHFSSCASVAPRLRRVPRAGIATHPNKEEGGSSRETLSGENLPKKSSDPKFARGGPHPSAVTLRAMSSALARA